MCSMLSERGVCARELKIFHWSTVAHVCILLCLIRMNVDETKTTSTAMATATATTTKINNVKWIRKYCEDISFPLLLAIQKLLKTRHRKTCKPNQQDAMLAMMMMMMILSVWIPQLAHRTTHLVARATEPSWAEPCRIWMANKSLGIIKCLPTIR